MVEKSCRGKIALCIVFSYLEMQRKRSLEPIIMQGLSRDLTILQLKELIGEASGLSADLLMVNFQGYLSNDDTLRSLRLQSLSTLTVQVAIKNVYEAKEAVTKAWQEMAPKFNQTIRQGLVETARPDQRREATSLVRQKVVYFERTRSAEKRRKIQIEVELVDKRVIEVEIRADAKVLELKRNIALVSNTLEEELMELRYQNKLM